MIGDLPDLETLSFPKLRSIKDQIRLSNLPLLSDAGFGTTISTCPHVVVNATGLKTLNGIDPDGKTDNVLIITDNKELGGVLTFSTTSTNITITGNGASLTAAFPNLTTADSIELAQVSVVSLPLLKEAYEVVLRANTFRTFAAPKLQDLGGSDTNRGILVKDNQGLTEIRLPLLSNAGGLEFTNNVRLLNLTLENFMVARGNIKLSGTFER